MRWLRTRLRARLVLIALLAVAPAVGALALSQSFERQRARDATLTDNLRLVRLAASQQAGIFDGARRLLLTLSEFPPLRSADSRECQTLMANVLRAHPGYFNLTVANLDGSLFCSAAPVDPRFPSARGRAWFERAVQRRTTSIGDYQLSATTGRPAIIVAHPLLDGSGRVVRVLAATIGLDQLNSVVAHAELPRGAVVTLFDRSRTVLARFPDGGPWLGKKVPDLAPVSLTAGAREATSESVGVDGVKRLYVTVPVPASIDTGLYIGMGIDRATAFRDADRIFRGYVWVLGIVLLAALGAAIVAGHVFVLQPIKALKAVTEQVAAGDLSARTQMAAGIAGVGELEEAVNAMAAALDSRQHERDRVEQELRESEDRYRLLFARNPHPMWVYDVATLEFVEVNDAAVARYGYSRQKFLAMRITDIRPEEDLPRLSETLVAARKPWLHTGGWRHRLKSGAIIDVEISSHTLTYCDRAAVLVTAQDVTDRKRAQSALLERIATTALTADVGVALNRAADLPACLQSCAEALIAHLDGTVARIWIVDSTGALLELAARAGTPGDCDERWERVAVGQSGIGRIAQHRRSHFTNHAIGDAEVDDQEWLSREGLRMFAGCPLVVESRVAGVVALFGRAPLSEVMMTAVASAADLIALGIARHQAEAARRLLASIVANSDDAIVGATVDGTIISWNAGAERLFGYQAEEVHGRSVSLLCPTVHAEEWTALLFAVRHGQHVLSRETIRQRKDGSLVPVSITLSPMRDAAAQITGISGTVRDISERQQTERTLRESEERFRLVAETVTQVFWIADVAIQTIVYVSPAYERVWGRSCESLYRDPRSLLDAVHPDDRTGVLHRRQIQQEGRPFDQEYRIIRPDGEVRWIGDRGFPVVGADGTVVQYVGVAEDITDRLRTERALRDAEERMRFALEASHVGVWENNLKTGVAYWSDTCQTMHGLAAGAFDNTIEAFTEQIHPEDREHVLQTIERSIREHADAQLMYRTIWLDGTVHWISSVGRFFYDANGAPVRGAGIVADVTDRRSLEEQLRQSQKMEAIGQLAGGVAHDFNNLLTAILGFASFLAESLPATDERRADVDEIRQAAERAAGLTRQLLAFSRKQILAVRILHLGDVVGEVTPMMRRLLGESIDLTTTVGDRGLVKADPGQLQQVIVNLAVNAHDAMREGGRLTLETSDVVLDEAFVQRHPSVRPGPHVKLTVTDTGHGMDAATQKRIFEPFFTTKPQGQGTGLGLATVYGIVKQSGGSIWVESEPGHGTIFTVYLPRTNEDEEVDQPAASDTRAQGGAETVLLIEDEVLVRDYVYKVLSRRGYSVYAFDDPTRAIAYAEAHPAPIDLVLTDVVLPNMSGKTMAAQVLHCHPESKVLFMSGYADHAIVQQGILDPGTSFLQKPFTSEALGRSVRDVLDLAHLSKGCS